MRRVEQVRGVHYNNRSAATLTNLPEESVEDFYVAWGAFGRLANSDEFTFRYKLEPGEVLVMENNRVLHGRGGWSTAVDRKLQGCYVDIDELRSRLRASEEADGEPQQVGGWL